MPVALFGIGSLVKVVVEAVKLIPELVLAGAIDAINALFALIGTAITAILSELSVFTLPEPGTPEWVGEVNWFFPLGEVMTVATGLLVAYAVFLAASAILRKFGIIS